jgi:TolB protein
VPTIDTQQFETGGSAHPHNDIFVIDAYGTGTTQLTDPPARAGGPSWSPDGKQIAFHSTHDAGQLEVFAMNANGTRIMNLT